MGRGKSEGGHGEGQIRGWVWGGVNQRVGMGGVIQRVGMGRGKSLLKF